MRDDITLLTRRKAPPNTNKLLAMTDDDALVRISRLPIEERAPEPNDPVYPQHGKPRPLLHPSYAQHPPTPSTPGCRQTYRHPAQPLPSHGRRNIATKNIEMVMRNTIARWVSLDQMKEAPAKRCATGRRTRSASAPPTTFTPPANLHHPALGSPGFHGLFPQSRHHQRQAKRRRQDGDDYEMMNLF
jgi:hypothetical protein